MSEPVVSALIVKHIDELEAAIRYANGKMQPILERAIAQVFDDKRRALGWTGGAPADFDEAQWLAPEEWRMGGDPTEDDFYLSFVLDTMPCLDGYEPETWIGTIAGFAGAGIRLSAMTEALGQRDWKALLRSQGQLLDELVSKGFLCDPKTGDIALTVLINREAFELGFEEDALDEVFEPLGLAIDRIVAARSALDQLVDAIKAKVP